ncbi:NAD(P)/FAD-dependent oxidoreductase [Candidatus Bathyarchaeota archaeon]|nr:NAD(P)/FAD-dependent oxidoreductase [Candidatus Bathyarchaeota archaeon]
MVEDGALMYDAVVVGAGPIGSTVARMIAERGFKTLLCEEHEFNGRPCHCTGKLTAHAFEEFDLPRDSVVNSVRAALLHSPSGKTLLIRRKTVDSYILDRELFDSRLAEMAYSAGAELSPQTRLDDLHRGSDGFVTLQGRKMGGLVEFRTRLVIDAEGASPILLKKLDLQNKGRFLTGLQYEIAGVELDSSDTVELYFGREVAPGFFAWIVPLGDDEARVGLCIRSSYATLPVRDYLERFLRNRLLSIRFRKRRVMKTYTGVLPIGGPISKSHTDSVLVVGDSAAHVKSTSGGGIYFGLKAAEAAAYTAVESMEEGDTSERFLRRYEVRWRRSIGYELRATAIARRILDKLTDTEFDRLFRILSDETMSGIIQAYGDTAYQTRLLKPIMPRLLNRLNMPSDITIMAKIMVYGLSGLLS